MWCVQGALRFYNFRRLIMDYYDEDLEHMPDNAKNAFIELHKLGCPVKTWYQNDPDYHDYRGYFWISAEEGNSWEWLDYYSLKLTCGSEKLQDILQKNKLYFEWENAAVACVYDN